MTPMRIDDAIQILNLELAKVAELFDFNKLTRNYCKQDSDVNEVLKEKPEPTIKSKVMSSFVMKQYKE